MNVAAVKKPPCALCRLRFEPRRHTQRFCSRECSNRAHPGKKRDTQLRSRVMGLREEGLTYREIARETGRSLSFIGRLVLSMEMEAIQGVTR